MNAKYDGPERREYCAQHCQIVDASKKSVPWRFYVGSMSAVLMIAIAYVGINESRMAELRMHFEKGVAEHEIHVAQRMADAQLRYSEDVQRFIQAVGENRGILRDLTKQISDLNGRMSSAEAKQDLMLKKIRITE